MNKTTKIVLTAIIALPVVVGFVVSLAGGRHGPDILQIKRLGLVRIEDVIYSPDKYAKQLREYCEDNLIAGVLLRINTPGGGVAASQEIYREVLRFRSNDKPLVVSMESVAASGGYYVACGAQKIFADPGTITGSIGVILKTTRFTRLFEKIGVDMVTIKAGKFKDIGSPDRDMTDEERSMLQGLLDDSHRQFIDDISSSRGLNRDSVAAIADGRIFSGAQALQARLVDTLGSYEDAVDYLASITGLGKNARVVERKSRMSFWEELLFEGRITRFTGRLGRVLLPTGMYYLLENP